MRPIAPRVTQPTNRGLVELGANATKQLRQRRTYEFYPWNPIAASPEPESPRPSQPCGRLKLARQYQALLDSGEFENRAALALHLGVSRTRVTQVLRRLESVPAKEKTIERNASSATIFKRRLQMDDKTKERVVSLIGSTAMGVIGVAATSLAATPATATAAAAIIIGSATSAAIVAIPSGSDGSEPHRSNSAGRAAHRRSPAHRLLAPNLSLHLSLQFSMRVRSTDEVIRVGPL